jgi:2,3-bisphosphoglycerate-independent phosphoglycerate mutase
MEVAPCESYEQQLEALELNWDEHNYFFFHTKDTDERGEDGDFDAKVAAIENVDKMLPRILELEPDVLAVTGDHSTPVLMKTHSWHPVPVLLHSPYSRFGATDRFDENACSGGTLGRRPAKMLMPQMLAHGLRLRRWGA